MSEKSNVAQVAPGHKIHTSETTRTFGTDKHNFIRGTAYCTCGWDTPIVTSRSLLQALVEAHQNNTRGGDQ